MDKLKQIIEQLQEEIKMLKNLPTNAKEIDEAEELQKEIRWNS